MRRLIACVRRLARQKEGFTLVEMVVSIAALALISVFILDMFIVSSRLQHDAADIDRAALVAGQACEVLRTTPSDQLIYADVFDGARVTREGGLVTLNLAYDKRWTPTVDPALAYYELRATLGPSLGETAFPLAFGGAGDARAAAQRMQVRVSITRVPTENSTSKGSTVLCDFTTSRTFVTEVVK